MHKYPRTRHLEGSRLQPGDEDLEQRAVRASSRGRLLVVEEKLDGANAARQLRRRRHAAGCRAAATSSTGGAREKHFDLFKQWAQPRTRRAARACSATATSLYGEWLYAKHTVFYDRCRTTSSSSTSSTRETGAFLSTRAPARAARRRCRWSSVPVLHEGRARAPATQLTALVGRSLYKSADWRERSATRPPRARPRPRARRARDRPVRR